VNRSERRKQQKLNTRAIKRQISIAETPKKLQMEIPTENFGPSGIPCQLHILAQFHGDARADHDRLSDKSIRPFKILATLAKAPSTNERFEGTLSRDDGSSYIIVPPNVETLNLSGSGGNFNMMKNKDGELSIIEYKCVADSVFTARCLFQQAVFPMLDHLSYLSNCPILVDRMVFDDQINSCQTVDLVGPYHKSPITKSLAVLHEKMRPIYSLYREAQNSSSHFYRFLCYYKILEGLLKSLRADFVHEAKAAGVDVKAPRQLVPDHPELQDHLKQYVGKPLKAFFDGVLTPEFRDAVAHFGTTDHGVLNMSDPLHLAKYAGMIHISELCARVAIADHEALLSRLP
jgi:hypothetical protein